MKAMTKKEQTYWDAIKVQSGVVMLHGKVGIAKSAILRSIAEKNDLNYIDIRLSMVDETDVGVYPCLSEVNGMKVLDYALPRWAIEANSKPTLIHFEELNRASSSVRNASLQILLERCISHNFCFNKNVYMVTSGNLGEEDGTEVESFDSALNNRIIHFNHDLTIKEWCEGYADKNVNPHIVSFIKANPSYFYKMNNDDSAFATPRSWTFLSDFLKSNGVEKDLNGIIKKCTKVGMNYVGASITSFLRYCQEINHISINDVLLRWNEVGKTVSKFTRARISELLTSLKELDQSNFDDLQIKNMNKFLKVLGDDEKASFLLALVDKFKDGNEENDNISKILKSNSKFIKSIVDVKD